MNLAEHSAQSHALSSLDSAQASAPCGNMDHILRNVGGHKILIAFILLLGGFLIAILAHLQEQCAGVASVSHTNAGSSTPHGDGAEHFRVTDSIMDLVRGGLHAGV